jgi:ribose 1,5-bisphosphokinase
MVEETIVRFNRVEVIEITASREIIRDRLMARGRESEAEIMVRQLREISPGWAANAHVTQIKNEGTLDEAVESFVDAVVRLSTHAVQHVRRA